jgi:hypothetical protein
MEKTADLNQCHKVTWEGCYRARKACVERRVAFTMTACDVYISFILCFFFCFCFLLNWSPSIISRHMWGWDSPVDVSTRYGLDGPGIESRWGEIFRTRPDRSWGAPVLLNNGCRVCFSGIKWSRRGVNRPPPSSAEVKEIVELYFYFPSGLSWPFVGRT